MVRILRPSCANSRIPSRHDALLLLRPSPPSFSPHCRINAPLQVQSTTAFAARKVPHTALSLVSTARTIAGPVALTYEPKDLRHISQPARWYSMSRCISLHTTVKNTSHNIFTRNRAFFFSPVDGISLPPSNPLSNPFPALLNFARSSRLLARSQST